MRLRNKIAFLLCCLPLHMIAQYSEDHKVSLEKGNIDALSVTFKIKESKKYIEVKN